MFSRIFKAAILDTKIESLSMCYGYQGTLLLPSDLFREVLSHRDCSLKGLHLYDINFEPARIDSLLSNAVNKTVQNLSAESSDELDLSAFVEVAVMFRSLVSLELRQCNISDPSPLYPLLIGGGGDGEGLTLARLQLWGNQIGQHSAIDFCGKLPQMTCLRDLCLGQNPFLFERRWVNILADAVQGNKSLECLGLDMMHEASPINQEELKGAFCKMDEALNRNSERRLYMEFEVSARSKVLPKNLWPLVLEKAQRISLSFYKTFEQRWEKQPVELLKVDLVNRLLKQKMQHEHLYEY